jgi:transposase
MHVVYPHCCGVDVHKRSITACLLVSGSSGKGHQEIRRFGTMTRDLWELADWLQGQQVTQVAMESTGVSWKPVWNILEGQFEVVLVNAQHIKAVPGRKTDSRIVSGLPNSFSRDYCAGVSYRPSRSGSCGS